MSIRLIGVSGQKGSGKDTFADIFLSKTVGWEKKSFAAKLKEVCALLTNRNIGLFTSQEGKESQIGNLGMTAREFLQKVGQSMRDVNEAIWINSLFAGFNSYTQTYHPNWIIPDTRYLNELKEIKRRGGICIRINRDLPDLDMHPSEHEWRSFKFDYVISNDSDLFSLEVKVKELLIELNLI